MIIEQDFIDEVEGYIDLDSPPLFRDPTGVLGIRRTDTLATVVPVATPFVKISTGRYRYEFADPAPGLTYNYWVEFTLDGVTSHFEKNRSTSPVPTIAEDSLSSVVEADTYFNSRYHCAAWFELSIEDRQRLLNDATRIIDNFEYLGYVTESTQAHQWPRGGIVGVERTVTPQTVLQAQYEMAYVIGVNGVDPEREIRGLRVTSRGFSSVRTTYDSRYFPEHTLLGIPSATAWAYLSPFFRRDRIGGVTLHRVS